MKFAIKNSFPLEQPLKRSRSGDHRRQGVALVITLILLSVITFMAVTFLVVTRGDKSSNETVTDLTIGRLAADHALEEAKMKILAPIMAFTNPANYGLIVSTNYQRAGGFLTGNTYFTNANYNYANGNFLNDPDFRQNLVNLLYSPRPPVFIRTSINQTIPDFRYYLDLNRNGRYDTNGQQPVINPGGGFYNATNGNFLSTPMNGLTLSNFFVGDPEWIGVLERPGFPHSASNRFVSRYAYLVVPTGITLDANYIHNYAKLLAPSVMSTARGDGFRRNQGAATWEVNLAAFL